MTVFLLPTCMILNELHYVQLHMFLMLSKQMIMLTNHAVCPTCIASYKNLWTNVPHGQPPHIDK